jgi:hypothetical protein
MEPVKALRDIEYFGLSAALSALALQKLRHVCQAEVRRLLANYPGTAKFYLSKYRDAIRQIDPNHLVLRPRKMRSGQRFSYLALDPQGNQGYQCHLSPHIHRDQSSLIPLDPEAFIQKALDLLASDRYLETRRQVLASVARRPCPLRLG